jgi:uroporphyrinogen-III synthase
MSRVLLVGSRVLHARGDLADGALREHLLAAECVVDDVVVYRTCVADADTLRSIADVCRSGDPDAVIYFSPSSVDGLEMAMGGPWIRERKAVALGPRTAEALRSRSIQVAYIPDRPSIDLIAAYLSTPSMSL